jgi:hypothetical protein
VEDSLLVMVLLSGTLLMTACHYGKSSHLLGAFLGGLMFCTLSSVKSVWHRKVRGFIIIIIKLWCEYKLKVTDSRKHKVAFAFFPASVSPGEAVTAVTTSSNLL